MITEGGERGRGRRGREVNGESRRKEEGSVCAMSEARVDVADSLGYEDRAQRTFPSPTLRRDRSSCCSRRSLLPFGKPS
jgi:hypothetical protein